MAKHTPGPWRLSWGSPFVITANEGETLIAKVGTDEEQISEHPATNARLGANATLIAASLELLSALEYAIDMQDGVEEARPDGYGTPKNTLAWMEEARAVITKATSSSLIMNR